MKSCEEMAAGVLERRDAYFARREKVRGKMGVGFLFAACIAIALFAKSGMFSTVERDYVDRPDMQKEIESPLQPSVENHAQMLRWMSAEEIMAEADTNTMMGVCVPSFVAYNGGFYESAGFDQSIDQSGRFISAGDEVWFSAEYRFPAYEVENEPDCVAIAINAGIQIYKRVFDVKFERDGIIYGIRYDVNPSHEVTVGAVVLEEEGFTVYETGEEDLYLVDLLPLLIEHWPVLFDGGENYDVAWMAAFPMGEAAADVPVAENPGSTGLLLFLEEVWGGSYTDKTGNMVIWLTENTLKNQQEVYMRNAGLNENNTIFLDADYTLAYLTQLMADISELMAEGTLPNVTTAALREDINRVEVTLTCEDAVCMERVLACDTLGGAVEFRISEGLAMKEQILVK